MLTLLDSHLRIKHFEDTILIEGTNDLYHCQLVIPHCHNQTKSIEKEVKHYTSLLQYARYHQHDSRCWSDNAKHP